MIDLYRIFLDNKDYEKFCNLILTIRPGEPKIQFIGRGRDMVRFHVTISEEELTFLKLTIPFASKENWIQQWPSK